MNFPIQPVGTKLIVEPLPKKEEKINSIVIAENANAELREGKVIAVSKAISKLYNVGDIILYPERKGVGQPINGKFYLWLDSDINKEEVWGTLTAK